MVLCRETLIVVFAAQLIVIDHKTEMSRIYEILKNDSWSGSHGETETGPYILRWRIPVLMSEDLNKHINCLKVVWPYANKNSGALPNKQDIEEMEVFENRLCNAWEHDGNAILAAVLTFDGARQWVFYTESIDKCGERICQMPQEEDPYPIEMTVEEDINLEYLHNVILSGVNWQKHQKEWEEKLR